MKKYNKYCYGFTVTEMIIAVGITLAVSAMVLQFIFNSWKDNSYLQAKANMKNMLQMSVNRLGRHISSSKRLFENTTAGNAYLGKIDMTGSPLAINTNKLPTINPNASFSPSKVDDPTNPFIAANVGNALLFTELLMPFTSLSALSDATLPDKRTLDVYQFSYYYINKDITSPSRRLKINNTALPCMDLIEWYSIQYVDYYQLNTYLTAITNNAAYTAAQKTSYKTAVNTTLRAANYKVAWDRSSDTPNTAFYDINAAGTLSASATTYKIQRQSFGNMLRLGKDEVTYSLAYNTDATTFPIPLQVPLFATASSANDKFPNGFETMITGPNSGRSVYTRIVAVGQTFGRSLISLSLPLTTYARDL